MGRPAGARPASTPPAVIRAPGPAAASATKWPGPPAASRGRLRSSPRGIVIDCYRRCRRDSARRPPKFGSSILQRWTGSGPSGAVVLTGSAATVVPSRGGESRASVEKEAWPAVWRRRRTRPGGGFVLHAGPGPARPGHALWDAGGAAAAADGRRRARRLLAGPALRV